MATPYLQQRLDTAPSTQDLARERLGDLPLLLIAPGQTAGRGRTGNDWLTAPRALAVSLALHLEEGDSRPSSLMAGVAAVRATSETSLKWPNDIMLASCKVGGILVERSGGVAVVGLGLNLFWPDAPADIAALFDEDPGPDRHVEIGALWGAEMMRMFDQPDWPSEEYRSACQTVGQLITWEPDGRGRAVDVAHDGGLLVDVDGHEQIIYSGEIRHLRPG